MNVSTSASCSFAFPDQPVLFAEVRDNEMVIKFGSETLTVELGDQPARRAARSFANFVAEQVSMAAGRSSDRG